MRNCFVLKFSLHLLRTYYIRATIKITPGFSLRQHKLSKPLRINIGLKFPNLTVTQHSSPSEVLCQGSLEHCLCDQHSLHSLMLFTLAKTNQAAFPEDL